MENPKTRNREISSILQAMKELDLKIGKIITLNEEDIWKDGDITIEIIQPGNIYWTGTFNFF
jgi:predicted AAA+ superfamily ATPase